LFTYLTEALSILSRLPSARKASPAEHGGSAQLVNKHESCGYTMVSDRIIGFIVVIVARQKSSLLLPIGPDERLLGGLIRKNPTLNDDPTKLKLYCRDFLSMHIYVQCRRGIQLPALRPAVKRRARSRQPRRRRSKFQRTIKVIWAKPDYSVERLRRFCD